MNFISRTVHSTARRSFFSTVESAPISNLLPILCPNQHLIPQPRAQQIHFQSSLQEQFTPQLRLAHYTPAQPQKQFQYNPYFEEVLEFMNRNKRKPKKANHGARPCSSVSRSKKKLRRHHYPK